jgi:hypothetical protein
MLATVTGAPGDSENVVFDVEKKRKKEKKKKSKEQIPSPGNAAS